MSTPGLTMVLDQDGKMLVSIYHHWDAGEVGKELTKMIKETALTDGGFTSVQEKLYPKVCNGMGCFAAMLVAHFKVGIGNVYLQPTFEWSPDSMDDEMLDSGADYGYVLRPKGLTIELTQYT